MKNLKDIRVLVACEYSGIVRDAFARLGCYALSCDLLPSDIPGNHYQGDVRDVINRSWDLVIAHPPCTFLTRRSQHWNKVYNRSFELSDAVDFFMMFTGLDVPFVAIENPIGIMSRLYCRPTQIIQPYYFGDTESKATCLWLKNLPPLKSTDVVEPVYHISKTGRKYSFADKITNKRLRQHLRSKSFPGIASAMASQWTSYILEKYA